MRAFDLKREHFAVDRVCRQQGNYRVSGANSRFDFSRPIHPHSQMPIDEHRTPIFTELAFKKADQPLFGLTVSLIEENDLMFSGSCHRTFNASNLSNGNRVRPGLIPNLS